MAETRKPTRRTDKSGDASHQDADSLTSSAVADPHAVAFAERQQAPTLYDDPTVATPGVLDDEIKGTAERAESGGPLAYVDSDLPVGLDPSVDNRDQVQPMLDSLYQDAVEAQGGQAQAVAAINAHESDAVDVEQQLKDQEARDEEARSEVAKSREEARKPEALDTATSQDKNVTKK
jgi:hypothetical protein